MTGDVSLALENRIDQALRNLLDPRSIHSEPRASRAGALVAGVEQRGPRHVCVSLRQGRRATSVAGEVRRALLCLDGIDPAEVEFVAVRAVR